MNNIQTDIFDKVYPKINSYILNFGESSLSRNGDVKKVREFVTRISNPHMNLVGGFGRRINPFFLFVEALWIWCGRNDVATLKPFNDRMSDYSDNGRSFHAAYGHRLRSYFKGCDQVSQVIEMLSKYKNTRRCVMQIWNSPDDLGTDTKDIPCNDMITVSIDQDNKLRFSIFNRSNDLHWGLPTNIYQFSTIGKFIANCLGIEYGYQTHFSNDLHIYTSNPIAENMEGLYNVHQGMFSNFRSIYDYCIPIDFSFKFQDDPENIDPLHRLNYIDFIANKLLQKISDKSIVSLKDEKFDDEVSSGLIFAACCSFLYKESKIVSNNLKTHKRNDYDELIVISEIIFLAKMFKQEKTDFALLAVNFFASRLKNREDLNEILKEFDCDEQVKGFIGFL